MRQDPPPGAATLRDGGPADLPRLGFDLSLPLLREGYVMISNRCDQAGTDGFRSRLMLRDVVCLRGAEAVDLGYSPEGTTRQGAMPSWVLHLLQDQGSVQQMEGPAHRRRKALFLRLLVDSAADEVLAARLGALWTLRAQQGGSFDVLKDSSRLLARAACEWCGLGPAFAEDARLAEALFEMSDRTGHVLGALPALARRRGAERRLRREVIARRQTGFTPAQLDTPLAVLTLAEEEGALLPPGVVAVELLNLLRPIVAVGRYIAFAAQRLILHPDWRDALAADDAMIAPFCEKVRRISPFFPAAAAICTRPMVWRGVTLPKGQWVLADLYGTCNDPGLFREPDAFRPGRGLDWRRPTPGFAPQGAGDAAVTHRCPGEKVTVALMAAAVRLMVRGPRWTAPDQDLSVDMSRMPARPAGGPHLVFDPVEPSA